ncbi:MAG: diguanylate cyclase [Oscillospiraceae bacterium]
MKIRTMLMASAMLFAIVPMVIYSVFAGNMLNSDGDKEFRQTIKEVVANERSTLQAYIDSANFQVNTILNNPDIQSAISGKKTSNDAGNFLAQMADINPEIESIALVDKDGSIFCGSAGKTGQFIDNFSAYDEYADGALYYNDVKNPEATGGGTNPTMFIKEKQGDVTLLVNYKLSNKGFLYNATGGSTFYNGSVTVADSSESHNYNIVDNFKVNLFYEYPKESFQAAIEQLTDETEPYIIEYSPVNSNNNEKWYAAMIKVGGENGLIAIASCPVTANANSFSLPVSNSIVLAVVLISLVAIAGAIVVSIVVTKPLKIIEETLVKVRRGDHEARIPTVVSNNEYGQMSRAFNNLLDEIVVSEDRYRTITEMSDNIIFEWNFKTNEVFFSNNFNKKFSYRAPSDHFGDSFLLKAKLHEEDSERYKSDLEKLGRGEEFKHNEYRMKNIYGDYIWVLIRTATLSDKEGNPLKIVGVILDIDRAKKSEQQLTERASFDSLTELYNRETIESQIDNEINLSEARKSEMAVLFVDVDDFKHYNDQYSHATGDQVLKFVARTVKGIVGEFGFAGRYGGDEFIACVRNAEINDPTRVAQDIIARLDEGFDCDGEHLTVSVSIGIAVIKDDYNTRVEYLIGKADDAMYSVKKNGKSNFAYI